MPFEPRAWQDEFMVAYTKADKAYFQLVASVGAGKTPGVYHLLSSMPNTLLLAFAPRLNIVRSWRDTPTRKGFSPNIFEGYEPGIEKKIGIGRDYQGLAATFNALGYAPLVFRNLVRTGRWLIVFDENHHLSAEDTSRWGDAAKEAFHGLTNIRILGLSGTPIRTDGSALPFAEYVSGKLVMDYKYLYRDAVRDRVVRPVEFKAIDAQARISGPEGFKNLAIEDARGREIPQVIRSAIDYESDWLAKAISLGWSYLQEDMTRIPNAAMIIHTHSIFAAGRVATLARTITGHSPVVVTSGDDEDAVTQLARFNDSQDRILIVVAMASEGTDIARLTVGIHATNVRTRLDFEQRFGRQVRLSPYEEGKKGQPNRPITARYIIPAAEPHVRFAREIYEEVAAAIRERSDGPGGPGGPGGGLGQPVLPASDAELRHTFYGGMLIEDEESWDMAGQLALKFGVDQMEVYQTLTQSVATPSEPAAETLQEREKRLRNRLGRRVKQLGIEDYDGDIQQAWTWVKGRVGNWDPVPAWSLSDINRALRLFGLADD